MVDGSVNSTFDALSCAFIDQYTDSEPAWIYADLEGTFRVLSVTWVNRKYRPALLSKKDFYSKLSDNNQMFYLNRISSTFHIIMKYVCAKM